MSIKIVRFTELKPEAISALQSRLSEYYSSPPSSYYEIADEAANRYTPELQPFHCDLVGRIRPGMTVLEFGCGTAHLCRFVEARGGIYTGMDFDSELLTRNRRRFPRARFLFVQDNPDQLFDLVASLYTIEHIVDPVGYLERMWGFCKPGWLLAVICPEFVDTDSYAPSLYYGKTARRFRDKARSLDFLDMLLHVLDLKWYAPRWKKHALRSDPGAFWINLRPSELAGKPHGIDTDAVYLSRLADLTWWFEKRGASIVATSHTVAGVSREVLRFNSYVLAQKPMTVGTGEQTSRLNL
jgi:SAM-dependent methyltransferase